MTARRGPETSLFGVRRFMTVVVAASVGLIGTVAADAAALSAARAQTNGETTRSEEGAAAPQAALAQLRTVEQSLGVLIAEADETIAELEARIATGAYDDADLTLLRTFTERRDALVVQRDQAAAAIARLEGLLGSQ